MSYLHQFGIQSFSSKEVSEDMVGVNTYKRDFWVNKMGAFTDKTYPEFQNVQWQFTGESSTINLKSGETLSLLKLKNPAIASSQIVVRVDSTGDLIVGDLIHYKAHAWLEGPLVEGAPIPMISSWIKALDELYMMTNENALVYGGRGEVQKLGVVVEAQKNYLKEAEQLVENYVAYTTQENKNQSVDDVVNLFKNHFHDYKLPYMIKYSVQPLINQKNESLK